MDTHVIAHKNISARTSDLHALCCLIIKVADRFPFAYEGGDTDRRTVGWPKEFRLDAKGRDQSGWSVFASSPVLSDADETNRNAEKHECSLLEVFFGRGFDSPPPPPFKKSTVYATFRGGIFLFVSKLCLIALAP